MIDFDVQFKKNLDKKLRDRVDKGVFRSIANAAASIRKTARSFIKKRKGPSPPGEPLHTRGQAKRPSALLFTVDGEQDEALVGFTHSVMGESMMPHEMGGVYKGETFPERSVMSPALEINLVRFADSFEGSVGE